MGIDSKTGPNRKKTASEIWPPLPISPVFVSKLQYIADRLEAGLAAQNNGHLVDERKVI